MLLNFHTSKQNKVKLPTVHAAIALTGLEKRIRVPQETILPANTKLEELKPINNV